LFIDEEQINRFYDAVVHPENEVGPATITISKETAEQVKNNLNAAGKVSLDLGKVFPGLGPKFEIGGGYDRESTHSTSDKSSETVTVTPIKTAQRQLVQLSLHYLVNQWGRLYLVNSPFSREDWRTRDTILDVPRELVFLDFPGEYDASRLRTKFIPMTVEFEKHCIVRLFENLAKESGEKPPNYPSPDRNNRHNRENYWQWFDKSFDPQRAMRIVEDTARDKGPIRWITYCVPITEDVDPLYLRFSAAGKFDTGVFAYSLIWRGYENGIRLVGTLKSGPEMNVLAIYEK
jgi:hypothetical protein